jgi:hypothetical protein
MGGVSRMIGDKKTYLYPANMRSNKGCGNFFVVKMYKGSKWLCHSTKEDTHRVMISDEAYEALVKDAKENNRRFSEKNNLVTNK